MLWSAIGATSDAISLSKAAGLKKAVFVIINTPLVAKSGGLDNPISAMI